MQEGYKEKVINHSNSFVSIKIEDHKNLLIGMTFNFKKKDRAKIIKFYYNL